MPALSTCRCCGVSQNTYHTLKDMRIVMVDGTVLDTADPASCASFMKVGAHAAAGGLVGAGSSSSSSGGGSGDGSSQQRQRGHGAVTAGAEEKWLVKKWQPKGGICSAAGACGAAAPAPAPGTAAAHAVAEALGAPVVWGPAQQQEHVQPRHGHVAWLGAGVLSRQHRRHANGAGCKQLQELTAGTGCPAWTL